MKKYAVVVVDDEPIARTILEHYIRDSEQLELSASLASMAELKIALEQQPIDLLLLDICLKHENSLKELQRISQPPKVIFITANRDYAPESYELDAVDYLLKPVSQSRFTKAIEKFIRLAAGNPTLEAAPPERLYFKTTLGHVGVAANEILYCTARRDYMKLVCQSQQLLVNMTMKALEEKLQPHPEFIRIHKSHLINKNHVEAYVRHEVRIRETVLPVGERFRKAFQRHWQQ